MNLRTNIKAVFDCNVFLQAITNTKSPARACVELVREKTVRLFVSEETLTELKDVLERPYIKDRFKLSMQTIEEYIENLRNIAKVLTKVPKVFSLPRDVDDEIYINLAVKTEADFIVTRDKDLIDLMTDYDIESKKFRQKFRPLKIVQPLEFLSIVENKLKESIALKP